MVLIFSEAQQESEYVYFPACQLLLQLSQCRSVTSCACLLSGGACVCVDFGFTFFFDLKTLHLKELLVPSLAM